MRIYLHGALKPHLGDITLSIIYTVLQPISHMSGVTAGPLYTDEYSYFVYHE